MVLPSVFAPGPLGLSSALVVRENSDGTISASLPLDCATMDNMRYILNYPKYLTELDFIPPRNPQDIHRLQGEINATLVWLFSLSSDLSQLERVVLPIEFLGRVQAIFQSLHGLPALKSLTIAAYNDSTSDPFGSELLQAFQGGIQSLPHLEELTIPAGMVTGPMVALLDHLFDSSIASYDGKTVQYHRAGVRSTLFSM